MDRIVAFTLLAASLVLFGFAMEAQAQSYTPPAGIPVQTAQTAQTTHATNGR